MVTKERVKETDKNTEKKVVVIGIKVVDRKVSETIHWCGFVVGIKEVSADKRNHI